MNCEGASLLEKRLDHVHLSSLWLERHCNQIVLFGSRTINTYDPNTDFDLLCVVSDLSDLGSVIPRVTPGLDLVWISEKRLTRSEWLGSELAQHIAQYGIWLWGEDNWTTRVFSSEEAIAKKRRQIRDRASQLLRRWERLLPAYQRKYSRLLRRDIQRLRIMLDRQAVPPSPILDREWNEMKTTVLDLAKKGGSLDEDDIFLISKLKLNNNHCKMTM